MTASEKTRIELSEVMSRSKTLKERGEKLNDKAKAFLEKIRLELERIGVKPETPAH